MPLLNSTWNSEKFDFNKMMAIMKRDYANDPIFYIAADIDQKNTSRYLLNVSIKEVMNFWKKNCF